MAIARDAATEITWASGTSVSGSHTCTGSNLVLTVWPITIDNGLMPAVTSVTYNGVSLTSVAPNITQSSRRIQGFALANPATGSNTVSVTWASTPNSAATVLVGSYTGCKQTGIPDATGSNTSASTNALSVSVTTVADNCWLVGAGEGAGFQLTASTNTSSFLSGNGGTRRLFDTNAAQTPAGSKSMRYTMAGTDYALFSAISLAPYVAAGATTNPAFLLNFATL